MQTILKPIREIGPPPPMRGKLRSWVQLYNRMTLNHFWWTGSLAKFIPERKPGPTNVERTPNPNCKTVEDRKYRSNREKILKDALAKIGLKYAKYHTREINAALQLWDFTHLWRTGSLAKFIPERKPGPTNTDRTPNQKCKMAEDRKYWSNGEKILKDALAKIGIKYAKYHTWEINAALHKKDIPSIELPYLFPIICTVLLMP